MTVTHLDVTRRTPFPEDYERIDGTLSFAVDPTHHANARIVDLDKAPRDDEGRVQFTSDFVLLQPRDPARANRRLLSYIVNRGQRVSVPFNHAPPRPVTQPAGDEIDVGDGFLMRRGWTVLFCGWQWDVQRKPGLTGMVAPQAVDLDGRPLAGPVTVAFQPNEPHAAHLLAHWPLHPAPGRQPEAHEPYPAANIVEPNAVLTVRSGRGGKPTIIPREQWQFARDEHGQPIPDDRYVWLAGGFTPGAWYEVTYTTRLCPVVGTGLLAIRDSAAWLRHSSASDNPAAGRLDFAYAHGRSQCGRFLREFVYHGLNLDEQDRQVFDGLLPDVAGARRGEFNQRYGQPSETNPFGFGGQFPFTADAETDPLAGHTDGLLVRQRQLGGVPRIFTTNTASEYWRADCSLIHTDLTAVHDVEPPAEERIYVVAGHQHGAGAAVLTDTTPIGARGGNAFNLVDGTPVLRAFLVNLDRWASEGIEPPASTFPRLADGTAVPRASVLAQFGVLPGAAVLDESQLPTLQRVDLGAEAGAGVARFPVQVGDAYPSLVSAVDADGNELAGIRLPDVAVPVATYTGWNVRHPGTGGAGQLLDMMGSTLPFAPTEMERSARGDPRPSIAARYRDRDDYLGRVRAAAHELAVAGYLLTDDVDLAVELAMQRYDLLAPAAATAGR